MGEPCRRPLGLEDAAYAASASWNAAFDVEGVEDELGRLEQVTMPTAAMTAGELAQAGRGEVCGVAIPGLAQPGSSLDPASSGSGFSRAPRSSATNQNSNL